MKSASNGSRSSRARPRTLLLLCSLLLAFASSPGLADSVLMDNGDSFSGTVKTLADDFLVFKTEFGELKLPWQRIVELESESPLQLTLEDGALVSGAFRVQQGQLRFHDNASLASIAVPLREVVAIDPLTKPAVTIQAHVSAGASLSRGNSETEDYHVDAEFTARSAVNRFSAGFSGNYGTDEDNRQTKRDASIYAGYDHFFSKRWYTSSNLGLTHDEFRDLRLRTTVGGGIGYQFSESSKRKLAAELGISFIHEDFYEAEDESQPAARWALNYRYAFASGLTFVHRHELFVGLDRSEDILLNSQTGLRIPIYGRLSGGLDLNFDYDWEPPAGARKEDIVYLLKLIYSI